MAVHEGQASTVNAKNGRATGNLKQLAPADKEKVANLLRKVVQLTDQNNDLQRSLEEANGEKERMREREEKLRKQNKEVIAEASNLKSKLANAFSLVRTYQHKVRMLNTSSYLFSLSLSLSSARALSLSLSVTFKATQPVNSF